jgi:hypothetical protein
MLRAYNLVKRIEISKPLVDLVLERLLDSYLEEILHV